MRDVLAWMMEVKKGCDKTEGVKSPLPWGSEGSQAKGVEREWSRLCAKGLRKFGGRLWSGYGDRRAKGNGYARRRGSWWDEEWEEREDREEDGWFEIWEGVVKNRCAGWVVEPQHLGSVSLEDDDEVCIPNSSFRWE